MGQPQSRSECEVSNEELLNKLTLVLTEHSRNFSEVHVYRLNEKPFDYYLRFRETAIDSEAARRNILLKRELYRSLQNIRCLVKVQASETKSVTGLCSNSLEFDSYARYHNYTLENALQCKLARNRHFKEADLFYIMASLLQVGEKISSVLGKSYRAIFKPYKVYLSTEGYVKIYPFQLVPIAGNSLTRAQQDTATNSSSEVEVNLAPKKSGEAERSRNYKDDLKDLALLIIQLVLLSRQEETGSASKQQLQFCLNRQIGQGLKALLLNIIANKGEFTYQSLMQQLQSIRERQKIRPSYCIRLQQDISLRQSQIMKRRESDISSQKEQKLKRLSSINQNLVASKIELLYKRHSLNNQ